MTVSLTRVVTAGTLTPSGQLALQAALTAATAVECVGLTCDEAEDIDGDADPATDRLTLLFDAARTRQLPLGLTSPVRRGTSKRLGAWTGAYG